MLAKRFKIYAAVLLLAASLVFSGCIKENASESSTDSTATAGIGGFGGQLYHAGHLWKRDSRGDVRNPYYREFFASVDLHRFEFG